MQQTLNAHYVAGIIDGEGSLMLTWKWSGAYKGTRPKYIGPIIAVTNTNEHLITLLAAQFKGNVCPQKWLSKQNANWKPAWTWSVRSWKLVKGVLDFIEPYLIVKQPQAVVMRQFLNSMQRQPHGSWGMPGLPAKISEERQRLFDLMKILNRRGRMIAAAETERQCPSIEGEATVRTPWQHGEAGRNVLPRFDSKLS